MWALAGGVGPVLGGVLSELATWRWIFWINLPISGTAFMLLWLFLDVHNPRTQVMEGVKAIDWFGSLSMLGFTLMLLLGLDFGGTTFAWNSPTVICLIAFGCVMSIFFVYSEKRLANYPLMPLGLFSKRSNIASMLVASLHGFVCGALPYVVERNVLADCGRLKLLQSTTCHYTSSRSSKLLRCTQVSSFYPSP
jgi:MFS family permease